MADTKLQFIPHMKTNSCCCFSLKTGCLIIGYFGAIWSSLQFISTVFSLLNNKLDPNLLIIPFICCMVDFFAHFLLIQGVNEQKPRKMYFWIYRSYIGLIIVSIMILLGIIVSFGLLVSGEYTELVPLIIGVCFIMAIFLGIGYHIFSSVVIHCQDIILILSRGKTYTA